MPVPTEIMRGRGSWAWQKGREVEWLREGARGGGLRMPLEYKKHYVER